MAKTDSFLAADFGAGSLKLAEFETNEEGALVFKQYVIKPLGLEGSQDAKREALILKTLQEAVAGLDTKARQINVSAPGYHVFSKFVKLPPVDPGKVTQIIQYEAQQNVPFPLAEVVWDYQILGTTPGGELEVLLVAIKSDIVEGLFRTTEAAGLRLQICDVSPAALCNAFRFNYSDLEDCTMLLDIGAKTSNLLFFEKGKVFARSINLGANSITQDFANEAKLKFDQAEKIKVAEGFVSLGGAYEEPENQHQAAISKIARQFMTRLHIQVNQTVQFYRGQQCGAAPQRLFLAGGASIMPYTAQFFAEKLNVPVEYLNPFRSVQIDPAVNLEELSPVAHSLGEVVGLGLRELANCPVELNLMPESTLRWQSFNQKKPYFIATLASLVLMALAVGFLYQKLGTIKRDKVAELQPELEGLRAKDQQFKRANGNLTKQVEGARQYGEWIANRAQWPTVLREVQGALLRTEALTQREFGSETGVWIEQMSSFTAPMGGDLSAYGVPGMPPGMSPGIPGMAPGMNPEMASAYAARYGERRPGMEEESYRAPMGEMPGGDPNAMGLEAATNAVGAIKLQCRGVSLSKLDPSANNKLAFAFQDELKRSPVVDAEGTKLDPQITDDETTGTFSFGVTLALKRPLKL
jgi:type IV pilus assembly protein PilM